MKSAINIIIFVFLLTLSYAKDKYRIEQDHRFDYLIDTIKHIDIFKTERIINTRTDSCIFQFCLFGSKSYQSTLTDSNYYVVSIGPVNRRATNILIEEHRNFERKKVFGETVLSTPKGYVCYFLLTYALHENQANHINSLHIADTLLMDYNIIYRQDTIDFYLDNKLHKSIGVK